MQTLNYKLRWELWDTNEVQGKGRQGAIRLESDDIKGARTVTFRWEMRGFSGNFGEEGGQKVVAETSYFQLLQLSFLVRFSGMWLKL